MGCNQDCIQKEKVKEFHNSICHIQVTLMLARQQQSK